MELEQKYTGVNNFYEVEEDCIFEIRKLPVRIGLDIARQLDINARTLPEQDGWTQTFAGVSHRDEEPVFFIIEFLKQHGEHTLYLDFEEVDSDTYLDFYIQNKILKSNAPQNEFKKV